MFGHVYQVWKTLHAYSLLPAFDGVKIFVRLKDNKHMDFPFICSTVPENSDFLNFLILEEVYAMMREMVLG